MSFLLTDSLFQNEKKGIMLNEEKKGEKQKER